MILNDNSLEVHASAALGDTKSINIASNRAFIGYDGSASPGYAIVQASGGKGVKLIPDSNTFASGLGLIVAPTGKVGIGTNNPLSRMHITGNDSNSSAISTDTSDYALKFDSANTTNYFSNAIAFAEGSNINSAFGSFDDGSSGRQGMWWATKNVSSTFAERMRLSSEGNLILQNGFVQEGQIVLTAGTYNNVDVSDKAYIICDTSSGDITLNGFSNGINGQSIQIIKSGASNNLILNHFNASGNQKFLTSTGATDTRSVYCNINAFKSENWILST